ncbi:MAG: hypothetical protein KDA60_20910, partial [Planctomycetales bacterium]|nr:hypothetical protein [Planctomycetales bacterium]
MLDWLFHARGISTQLPRGRTSTRPRRRRSLAIDSLEQRIVLNASLTIHDDIHRIASLTSTSVTMTGTAELHLTDSENPIAASVVNLNSPDAWLFFDHLLPSTVASTLLNRVRVNGALAVLGNNVRVTQYGVGAVVVPHGVNFRPLEVFTQSGFDGDSTFLRVYEDYDSDRLGTFSQTISSFKLKRGYMATLAEFDSGAGASKTYVAQDGDLNIPVLPGELENNIRFIRIFPWRWTTKKGIAGNIGQQLETQWWYNWNIDQSSSLDREYVAIRQARWWPGLGQDWETRGINHLLGYNEPDRPDQANLNVGDALWSWPDLLSTGLRVGAPAVSDGGLNWLYSFMDGANAEGKRVDFVPVHYYRCHNPADPAGAATQFYDFLKGVHDRVQRPLWITEWNNGANWTGCGDPTFAQQQAAISAIVAMLESTPFVERYAIYNWVEDVRRVQWDDGPGTLTPAGEAYRDQVSRLAYLQEVPAPPGAGDAYYAFDGDIEDSSGNGHPALRAGARTFTAGPHGQAVTFDGHDDYVQLSAGLGDSSDFTFAAWVNWNGGASWQRIVDLGQDTNRYLFLTPRSGGAGGT